MDEDSSELEVVGCGDPADRPLDTVLDLLVDQRRRYVLECLADHSQAVALADLAEDVAVRENGGPITEIPGGTGREIRTLLHHHHLPKLAEAGVVDYDRGHHLIRPGESADQVERALSLAAVGQEVHR